MKKVRDTVMQRVKMKAVVQCGGKGTRLRPYTSILPKPLMPIGAKPIIELLLKWLRRNGIEDIYVTTGYLSHLIQSFCGNGQQWGIRLEYTQENEPLGTMGPLSLLRDKLDCTFLVINGDTLTDLSLDELITSHRKHGDPLTIATAIRTMKMDYGVIEETNGVVTRFREKPTLLNCVSMGAYCMEPEILRFIPSGTPFGFDDLVLTMMGHGVPVHTHQHSGVWLDIGRPEDFHTAQKIDWDERSASMMAMAI